MCKNLMVIGFNPEKKNHDLLWDFLMTASPFMTVNDKDGLGYAAISPSGLWGERWLDPKDAWKLRKIFTEEDKELLRKAQGTFIGNEKFNTFGELASDTAFSVLMHARMATCEKNISNTHPFIRGNSALIHNGVISNHGELEKITSTCDSEVILNSYFKHDVANKPENIKEVARDLRGYFACGIISKDADGVDIVDVFRGGAQLWATWVKPLDALVICTRSDIVDDTLCLLNKTEMEQARKDKKYKPIMWNSGASFEIKEEVMIRFNSRTGQFMNKYDFFHNRYTAYDSSWKGWEGNRWERKETVEDEKKRTVSQEITELARLEAKKEASQSKMSKNLSTNSTEDNDPFYCSNEGYRISR